MASSDTNFVYTCTGSEGSDFNVMLPKAWGDDLYFVTASLAGVASLFDIDLPNSLASDRTTTQFRVKTSAAVTSGDSIEFRVYDKSSIVDLRTYGLVIDVDDGAIGGTIATANGKAISQAFAEHPSNAVFLLPMGKIFVNRDLAAVGPRRFAAVKMTSLNDVVLTGYGPGATQLIMTGSQANGPSRMVEIFESNRVTISNMTMAHGPNLADVDTSQLQNHHLMIGITNQTSDCTDIQVDNIFFGPCIGDAIFVAGSDGSAGHVRNSRITNVTMRTGGHPLSPNGGSRSCLHFLAGVSNCEVAHFFMHGAKNSPLDFEPSVGKLSGINIHDGTIDNTGGVTVYAASLAGVDANNLLSNARLTNVDVIEGQLQIVYTDNCTLENVNIYASGKGGFAGATTPLLLMSHKNLGTKLRNVNLTRDTGCAPGPLLTVNSGATTGFSSRLTVEGGEWLTRVTVGPSSDLTHIQLFDVDHFSMRGTRLRIEDPTPTNHNAVTIRAPSTNITNLRIEGVLFESPHGLLGASAPRRGAFVLSADSATAHSISNVVFKDVVAASAAVNGIVFNSAGPSTVEPYPMIQGCDFSGCSKMFETDNTALNAVFPIVSGNKGSVSHLIGTVDPEAKVTAVQGSLYTRQNGDATRTWIKTFGTGNTGWTPMTPQTIDVPAAAFQVALPAANYATGSVPETDGSIWAFTAAAGGTIVAPLTIPIGFRIRSIVWHLNKAGQAGAMTMKLRKRIGMTTSDIRSVSDTSSGPSWITNTVSSVNYTIESTAAVWLQVTAGHASHQFGWAEVICDAPW